MSSQKNRGKCSDRRTDRLCSQKGRKEKMKSSAKTLDRAPKDALRPLTAKVFSIHRREAGRYGDANADLSQSAFPAQAGWTWSNSNAAPGCRYDFGRTPVYENIVHSLQPKLRTSAPGDALEQEADQIAARVLREPGAKGKKANSTSPFVADGLRSPARTLEPGARTFFERRFGHDFSSVRVHSDDRAARLADALNARAFTVGDDVVFAAGQFAPGTSRGDLLIAHELAHVVQQETSGENRVQAQPDPAPKDVPKRDAEVEYHIVTKDKALMTGGGTIHDSLKRFKKALMKTEREKDVPLDALFRVKKATDEDLLHYYFSEPPRGYWLLCTVINNSRGEKYPYYKFKKGSLEAAKCYPMDLGEHIPSVPVVPEE